LSRVSQFQTILAQLVDERGSLVVSIHRKGQGVDCDDLLQMQSGALTFDSLRPGAIAAKLRPKPVSRHVAAQR
jgi:hypothetical protein